MKNSLFYNTEESSFLRFVKNLLDFKKDKFIKGSLILLITVNLSNLFNFVFHFSMARMLDPAEYGVLTVLMSLIFILVTVSYTVQNIFSYYIPKIRGDLAKIKNVFKRGLSKSFRIAIISFLIYLPFAFVLSFLLEINLGLLIITGLMIFPLFLSSIIKGVLQGIMRFNRLGTNILAGAIVKLLLALLLVFLGLKIWGALAAVVVAALFVTALGVFFLRDLKKEKEKENTTKSVFSYSFSFFLASISIVIIFSLDVIVARRVFSPVVAGQYAAISILGKIIFFIIKPVTRALLVFVSENSKNKKETRKFLYRSGILLFLVFLVISAVYIFFPDLVIKIFFGKGYATFPRILIFVATSFFFLSLTNLISIYALSKNNRFFSFSFPFLVLFYLSVLLTFKTAPFYYSLGLMFSNITIFLIVLILILLGRERKPEKLAEPVL